MTENSRRRRGAGRLPSPRAPLSILVAEDNLVTQDLLKFLLTQRGHRVDIVEDGEEALKALRDNHYAIVLIDFHLPKMDGSRVVAAVKSSGVETKGTRFIGITGDVEGL